MTNLSFCIFTVAVLLEGTAATLTCIVKEMMNISPDHFITTPYLACRALDTKFDETRQEFKKCLDFEVDISKLEALHHEFCNPNSDFRQKVDRQRNCIARNLLHSRINCLSIMDNSPVLEDENILKMSMFDICQSLSAEMSKCFADKVGGPCGAEGLEVYRRIAQAEECFFTASCFSVAKQAIGESDLAEEIEEAEEKVVEGSLAQSDRYETAAATTYSALLWGIIVGLLFAVRW